MKFLPSSEFSFRKHTDIGTAGNGASSLPRAEQDQQSQSSLEPPRVQSLSASSLEYHVALVKKRASLTLSSSTKHYIPTLSPDSASISLSNYRIIALYLMSRARHLDVYNFQLVSYTYDLFTFPVIDNTLTIIQVSFEEAVSFQSYHFVVKGFIFLKYCFVVFNK